MKNRFTIGDRVKYISLNKYGRIIDYVNINDKKDIKAQGYRYIVRVNKWHYSIPEDRLRMVFSRKELT